jgi:hypothetical protein
MKKWKLVVVNLLAAACTPAISSYHASSLRTSDGITGETYYLPRAILRLSLRISPSAGIFVVLTDPELVANTGSSLHQTTREDRTACGVSEPPQGQAPPQAPSLAGPYILSHRVSGLHNDTVSITVDRALLTSVNANTKEQLTAALTNLAKSVATLEADVVDANLPSEEVYAATFDPASCPEVRAIEREVRTAIEGVAKRDLRRALARATGDAKKVTDEDINAISGNTFQIVLIGYEPFSYSATYTANENTCQPGICVPVPTPAVLRVSFQGRTINSPTLHLPNRSAPVVIPVTRSFLADVDTKLTLSSGMLTKREVTRGSEVAALALLPATVVGAYFDTLATALTKRKTAYDNEVALIAARKSLADARKGETTLEADIDRSQQRIFLTIGAMETFTPAPPAVQVTPLVNRDQREMPSNDGTLKQ